MRYWKKSFGWRRHVDVYPDEWASIKSKTSDQSPWMNIYKSYLRLHCFCLTTSATRLARKNSLRFVIQSELKLEQVVITPFSRTLCWPHVIASSCNWLTKLPVCVLCDWLGRSESMTRKHVQGQGPSNINLKLFVRFFGFYRAIPFINYDRKSHKQPYCTGAVVILKHEKSYTFL